MSIRIKLKANYGQKTIKPKYIRCSDEQRIRLNKHIKVNLTNASTHEEIVAGIRLAADTHIPKKFPNPTRPFEYSEATEELLIQKKNQIREGYNDTALKAIRNKVSKYLTSLRYGAFSNPWARYELLSSWSRSRDS